MLNLNQITRTDEIKDPRNVWINRYAIFDACGAIVGIKRFDEIISDAEYQKPCYQFRCAGQIAA